MLTELKSVRISISKDSRATYESLVKGARDKAELYPFATMKDLFMAAACVGAKYNAFEEPSSKEGVFAGSVFDEELDVPVLLALTYQRTQDLDSLLDPRQVINISEGWAEGGIRIIGERLLNTPGPSPLSILVDMIEEEAGALY